MKKNFWDWVYAIVVTLASGMLAHDGYLLLQGRNDEWGNWAFIMVLVCLGVSNLSRNWDDPDPVKNAADVPRLTIGQGPKEDDSD